VRRGRHLLSRLPVRQRLAADDEGLSKRLARGLEGQFTPQGVIARQELVNELIRPLQVTWEVRSEQVDLATVDFTHHDPALAERMPSLAQVTISAAVRPATSLLAVPKAQGRPLLPQAEGGPLRQVDRVHGGHDFHLRVNEEEVGGRLGLVQGLIRGKRVPEGPLAVRAARPGRILARGVREARRL